jgi:hypothetical protein
MTESNDAGKQEAKNWWDEDEDDEKEPEKTVGLDEVYQEIQLASSRLMEAATAVVIESAGVLLSI